MRSEFPAAATSCSGPRSRAASSAHAVGSPRFGASLGLALITALGCGSPSEVTRPNLILIIADDHGYPDFGFTGSPHVSTPNLDRLAAAGTVFRQGQVTASYCTPSLRSLLTGLHPLQYRARILERMADQKGAPPEPGRDPISDVSTLPRVLGERGYASFQGDKFSEVDYRTAGFTDGMQLPEQGLSFGGLGVLGRETMAPVYEFIDTHLEQPFLLWFAPMLPHVPHDAGEEYRRLYTGGDLSEAAIAYYANISRFDDSVGDLLDYLDEKDLSDRSLVVFLSDNGWDQAPTARRDDLYDGPRGKLTLYDLGFRTPIVLCWPGRVPAGAVRDEIVSAVDLFPTLLDYAGAAPVADRPGHSLRPLLEASGDDGDGDSAAWPREVAIGHMPWFRGEGGYEGGHEGSFQQTGAFFLRDPTWRYIWYPATGKDELYNLANDPHEERDVSAQEKRLALHFRKQIIEWRRAMTS